MGALKKALSSVTDVVGLTDNKALEEQQKAYEAQQQQLKAQAEVDAQNGSQEVTQVDTGGAAANSAAAITGAQKKRRAGSISSVVGI